MKRDMRLDMQRFLPPLPRSFYLRQTIVVAQDLLGRILVRRIGDHLLAGKIVEVEAYRGSIDPAAHSYRGRTARNDVMFWEGGHLYVYFTYGMHFCCNVVTGPAGRGDAVLLRALEPTEGIQAMRRNRKVFTLDQRVLCSGPARICQALRIGRNDNGTDLCAGEIWIAGDPADTGTIQTGRSTRVGVRNGRKYRWRFFVKKNPFLSPGRPA